MIFEVKEDPLVPHEEDGIPEMNNEKLKAFAKGLWQFYSYIFRPQ